MRKIMNPQNAGWLLNIWAFWLIRLGKATFSIPFNKVVQPKMVMAIRQSPTQRLGKTTVINPSKKVM